MSEKESGIQESFVKKHKGKIAAGLLGVAAATGAYLVTSEEKTEIARAGQSSQVEEEKPPQRFPSAEDGKIVKPQAYEGKQNIVEPIDQGGFGGGEEVDHLGHNQDHPDFMRWEMEMAQAETPEHKKNREEFENMAYKQLEPEFQKLKEKVPYYSFKEEDLQTGNLIVEASTPYQPGAFNAVEIKIVYAKDGNPFYEIPEAYTNGISKFFARNSDELKKMLGVLFSPDYYEHYMQWENNEISEDAFRNYLKSIGFNLDENGG